MLSCSWKKFACILLAVANQSTARLRIEDGVFRDEQNRQVLLHGVNVVYKVSPYLPTLDGETTPEDSLTESDIEDLHRWGFNFVRLGVMWEAVERSEGSYDDAYLEKV